MSGNRTVRRSRRWVARLLTACGVAALLPDPAFAHQLVLTHATVVDVRTGRLVRDRTIAIDDARIAAIESSGTNKRLQAARTVDLHGAYVTPGFSDMHVHVQETSDPRATLRLMLANGITSYRLMSGSPELLEQRRKGALFPWPDTPDLLAMPGAILMPTNADTPAQAIAEVDRQAAQGADFIKVIDVPPDSFFAALAEAKARGLPFIGHLPALVDVWKASDEGMREIEHVGPNAEVLAGCSPDGASLAAARLAARAKTPPGPPSALERSLHVMPGNPVILNGPSDLDFMRKVIASFDEGQCRKLAARLAANRTWQTPTLIRLYTMEYGDDPAVAADPDMPDVARTDRVRWEGLTRRFRSKFPEPDRAMFHRLYALQRRTVKIFDEAGVPMLTGSDLGGAGWEVPGSALRKEFAKLSEAGLSPLTILRMTTLDPARLLGREAEFGTVEPGHIANLVVLRADPTRSAANLDTIDGVVLHGRLYDAADLRRLKSESAGAIRSGVPTHPRIFAG